MSISDSSSTTATSNTATNTTAFNNTATDTTASKNTATGTTASNDTATDTTVASKGLGILELAFLLAAGVLLVAVLLMIARKLRAPISTLGEDLTLSIHNGNLVIPKGTTLDNMRKKMHSAQLMYPQVKELLKSNTLNTS
jgi:hypothetical protein